MPKDKSDRVVAQEVGENKDRFVSSPNLAGDPKVAQRALDTVLNEINWMKSQRLRLENKWLLCYKLWDGTPLSKFVPSARSVHVPEPYKAVEAAVPRVRKGLTGAAEWFRPTASGEGTLQNLKNITELLQSDLYEDKFEQKLSSFIRGVLTYGDQPAKVYWKYRTRAVRYNKVKDVEVVTSGPVIKSRSAKMERGVQAVITEEHPTFDIRDIYDFYTDAKRFDLQESPGNSEFFVRTMGHVRQMEQAGLYMNVDQYAKNCERLSEQAEESGQGQATPGLFVQGYGDRRGDTDGMMDARVRMGEVPIIERWGRFDPDGTGYYKEYVITLAADHTVLQVRENPMWRGTRPYVCGHGNRSGNLFYSKGLIEVIIRLCMELDDTRNIRQEAQHLALSPMFRANFDFPYVGNQLTARPGQIFRGERYSIEPIHVPDVNRSAELSESAIKRDIQEVTGMPSLFQGQRTRGARGGQATATEVVTMRQEANSRIEETAYNIGVFALAPALEMFHALDQEYITKAKEISVLGLDGVRAGVKSVSPEQIAGQVRIDIVTLPEISLVGLHAAQMSRFIASMGDLIAAAPGVIDVQELMKMTFVRMFGYKDVDRIFPKQTRIEDMLTPFEENLSIIAGHANKVRVRAEDKDILHLQAHESFMDTELFQEQDEMTQRELAAHIQNHVMQLDRKAQAAIPAQPSEMVTPPGLPSPGGRAGRAAGGPTSEIGATRSQANIMGRSIGG